MKFKSFLMENRVQGKEKLLTLMWPLEQETLTLRILHIIYLRKLQMYQNPLTDHYVHI